MVQYSYLYILGGLKWTQRNRKADEERFTRGDL